MLDQILNNIKNPLKESLLICELLNSSKINFNEFVKECKKIEARHQEKILITSRYFDVENFDNWIRNRDTETIKYFKDVLSINLRSKERACFIAEVYAE